MWHWITTAISTYILHAEHGNGYQWHSGIGSVYTPKDLVYMGALAKMAHHKNCHRKGCWRFGHPHPEHGWPACKHHWNDDCNHLR